MSTPDTITQFTQLFELDLHSLKIKSFELYMTTSYPEHPLQPQMTHSTTLPYKKNMNTLLRISLVDATNIQKTFLAWNSDTIKILFSGEKHPKMILHISHIVLYDLEWKMLGGGPQTLLVPLAQNKQCHSVNEYRLYYNITFKFFSHAKLNVIIYRKSTCLRQEFYPHCILCTVFFR